MVALLPASGIAADYKIAPTPAWVIDVQPGVPTKAQLSLASNGQTYTLVDSQVLAQGATRERYRRVVGQAVNAKGVDDLANIQIDFDPSWQQIVLHSVNVIRNGQIIPKLATAKIRVIQREAELEARIFDGGKTAAIVLEDVRVGDSVDFSYSTFGRNPVFDGFEFGAFDMQYEVPVARVHARLLLPVDSKAVLKLHNAAPTPTTVDHNGLRERTWDWRNVPAITIDQGAPSWFSPFAWAEWSEFPDWASVAQWAQPLYQPPATLGPALEVEVARIEKTESTPSGRMLAVLRFVQGEIRYLGIEIGRNAHAPNPPDLVFRRRFGDCKDKTMLTLALLGRLGIEAHAALVNTDSRRAIGDHLPNPTAFDHVLVQARIDGKSYWIDPTRSVQESNLANLNQPDYDLSLLVMPGTTALASMKRDDRLSKRSLHVVFDARAGFAQPVGLTVETVYEGNAAESQRDTLMASNLDDLQKGYLQFYARSYPSITVAAPLATDDNKPANRITIRESYSITDMPSKPDKDGRRTVDIETPDVDGLLGDPDITIRRSPLQLQFPVDVEQTTEMHLNEAWKIEPVSAAIDDPTFSFTRTVKEKGKGLIIRDHYRTLTDEVAASDIARYVGALKRARAETGYQLYWSEGAAKAATMNPLTRINWPVVATCLLSLLVWPVLAVFAYRYDPSPAPGETDPTLVGISGWLILVAIGLVVSPFRLLATQASLINSLTVDVWNSMTVATSASYHAAWGPLVLGEVFVNTGLITYTVLVLVVFLQRRTSFRKFAIALYVSGFVVQAIDDLGSVAVMGADSITAKDYASLAGVAVSATLWPTYFLVSKRVRSTFARRLGEGAASPQRPMGPPPLPRVVSSG